MKLQVTKFMKYVHMTSSKLIWYVNLTSCIKLNINTIINNHNKWSNMEIPTS